MTNTVMDPITDAEEVHRRNPLLDLMLNVQLSELRDPHVAASEQRWGKVDQGHVALKFGQSSGSIRFTLHGSAYELRRLSAMLDQAAMEIERQWAERQLPFVEDLPGRCDRCHGTDTHNPEGVCDDCLASLDSPAIDGGGF